MQYPAVARDGSISACFFSGAIASNDLFAAFNAIPRPRYAPEKLSSIFAILEKLVDNLVPLLFGRGRRALDRHECR